MKDNVLLLLGLMKTNIFIVSICNQRMPTDKDHRLAPLVRLTQLRHLDLRNNYLLSLPAGCFAEWSCMNTLLLSHNQLASLPPDVGRMARSLEELDLTHNQLDALPTELAKLTRLRVLAVEENAIVELPAQLGSLTQLERLAVGTQSRRLRFSLGPCTFH